MNPIPATDIFDFLDQLQSGAVDRYEIGSYAFAILRSRVRQIVVKLRDSDDQEALEISDRLRASVSEWLTVPVPFDGAMLDALTAAFGDATAIHPRWGPEMRTLYDEAIRATEALLLRESPLRVRLRATIREVRAQDRTFRIYCHRRAWPHFESLFIPPTDASIPVEMFIHSVPVYRETRPFDVLVKVGPLRSRGWGSAPDALLTAPRFATLLQIVWAGCNDEPGFGYDPVSPSRDPGAAAHLGGEPHGTDAVTWVTRVTRDEEDSDAVVADFPVVDDLRLFHEMEHSREKRAAVLLQVDDKYGVLYPPGADVLSFDPDPRARGAIAHRVPEDSLCEGMFLIRPLVEDVDLGGVKAEHGHYSKTWKAKLEAERRADEAALIARLSAAGLKLVHLRAAVSHWCEAPTTVIHAPQQMKHFEILVRVLGLADAEVVLRKRKRVPWWQLAWDEVSRSRGEASQAGMQEREIVEEQLLSILQDLLPEVREMAVTAATFRLAIPPRFGVSGELLFFRVLAIEHGFRVPVAELRVVRELGSIEQWRD